MSQDLLQWIVNIVLGALVVYLSFRKAPAERRSLNGDATKSYAEAARLKGEENLRLEQEISELEKRLEIVERKKYRIMMEFEIGDPPSIGVVKIEPIVPVEPTTRPRKKSTIP